MKLYEWYIRCICSCICVFPLNRPSAEEKNVAKVARSKLQSSTKTSGRWSFSCSFTCGESFFSYIYIYDLYIYIWSIWYHTYQILPYLVLEANKLGHWSKLNCHVKFQVAMGSTRFFGAWQLPNASPPHHPAKTLAGLCPNHLNKSLRWTQYHV